MIRFRQETGQQMPDMDMPGQTSSDVRTRASPRLDARRIASLSMTSFFADLDQHRRQIVNIGGEDWRGIRMCRQFTGEEHAR